MRLLNVHTRVLSEFVSDTDIEPYAILSHTWAQEEVTLEDFQSLPKDALTAKRGYPKIDYCCLQAAADGYDWVWVDTCCIDKRSSAELSEAINSMFRWYKDSAVCYAYLADVHAQPSPGQTRHELAGARWFTRGWTLQELLAPRELVMYDRDWQRIGTRYELSDSLSKITRIEEEHLCGAAPLDAASVSKRMSWAAMRNTSRTEDIAYCLLGIFDVNMPLLYGEGKKAFRRLQEEILKANPMDHTLFAWGKLVTRPRNQVVNESQLKGIEAIEWNPAEAHSMLRGMFAESPREFLHSSSYAPWRGTESFYSPRMNSGALRRVIYPSVTGTGVSLELPLLHTTTFTAVHWPEPTVTQLRPLLFAILLCEDTTPPGHGGSLTTFILLPLSPWGYAQFGRTDELMHYPSISDLVGYHRKKQHLQIQGQSPRKLREGDFLIRRWGETLFYEETLFSYDSEVFTIMAEGVVKTPRSGMEGKIWAMHCRLTKAKSRMGFGIVFDCAKPERPGMGNGVVGVSLMPLLLDEPKTEDAINAAGFRWTHKSNMENKQLTPLFGRSMAVPDDTWRVDVAPFPMIEVRVQRMNIRPLSRDVEVVDITIFDRPSGTVP